MGLLPTAIKRKITHLKSGGGHFDISVVVPIYNTERYLADCINSILGQTKSSLQIILVDDGSTDGSATIGKAYAKRYPNLTYVYKKNSGVAATRNLGASLASGEYLTFVDSDDLLDPRMFERLYALAKHFDAQIATCGMSHFNNLSDRKYPSPLFDNAFRGAEIQAGNLEELPRQIFNTSCCNKLFLRSFYLKEELSFPEGVVYEDLPFSIFALEKALRIASTPEKLYFYRVRTGDETSITQQRHDVENLRARLNASRVVLEYLTKTSSASVQKLYQNRSIEHDLKLAFRSIPDTAKECLPEAIKIIASYVDDCIDADVLAASSSLAKAKIELCRKGNVDMLKRVIAYEAGAHKKAPIHLNGERLTTLAPAFMGAGELDVTKEVLWPEPTTSIEHIALEDDGNVLLVSGKIYQHYVPMAAGQQSYRAFLTDEFDTELAELEVSSWQPQRILQSHKVMRNLYDQSIIDYSGCGCTVRIPAAVFDQALTAAKTENSSADGLLVRIDYTNSLFSASIYASKPDAPVEAFATEIAGIEFAPGGWLRIKDCAQAASSLRAHSSEGLDAALSSSAIPSTADSKSAPALSVVAPIHGNDSDLPAALESLATQSLSGIQVILADDGSSLDGTNVALLYARRYGNFEYHHVEPGALGQTCNAGARFATGAYLAFASPYDTMAKYAYEHLLEEALKSNANIIAGDIAHSFDRAENKACDLARKAYVQATARMRVTSHPELLYSCMPWNHLLKRSFYEEQGLSWPEDAAFEDGRLMTKALFAAGDISYLPEPVFIWRKRNRSYAAIERQTNQVQTFINKLKLLKVADQELASLGANQQTLEFNGFKRLDTDLRSDLLQLTSASPEGQVAAAQALSDYLQTIPEKSFAALRAIERMKYHYAATGRFNQLIALREYELGDYKLLEVSRDSQGNYVGAFPFTDLDASFFTMSEDLKHSGLSTNINGMKLEEGALKITGQVYPYRIPAPSESGLGLAAELVSFTDGSTIKLNIALKKSKKETRALKSPNGGELTLSQPFRSYTLLIDFALLQDLDAGDYRILAHYSIPGLKFNAFELGKPLASKNIQSLEFTAGDAKITAHFGLNNELVLSVQK
ncbi:MAG: glycosyltransferase [Coriobacteriia bacterium]|nr:glycosyltransferase [Coriobacteriia bacterium]